MVCAVSATSRQHSGSEISGQALSRLGQAPPAGPAQRSAAPLLPSHPLPSPPPLKVHRCPQRPAGPPMCLVSTFLSHHHSLGTLCENEGLERPDAKTFGT